MKAGDGERARAVWAWVLGLTLILCAVAYVTGVPARWMPLVIGGGLGLLTALAAGAPGREDD
jgi:hypothetical protein